MAICSACSTSPVTSAGHPLGAFLSSFSSKTPSGGCWDSHCIYAVAFVWAPGHHDKNWLLGFLTLRPLHNSIPLLKIQLLHLENATEWTKFKYNNNITQFNSELAFATLVHLDFPIQIFLFMFPSTRYVGKGFNQIMIQRVKKLLHPYHRQCYCTEPLTMRTTWNGIYFLKVTGHYIHRGSVEQNIFNSILFTYKYSVHQ